MTTTALPADEGALTTITDVGFMGTPGAPVATVGLFMLTLLETTLGVPVTDVVGTRVVLGASLWQLTGVVNIWAVALVGPGFTTKLFVTSAFDTRIFFEGVVVVSASPSFLFKISFDKTTESTFTT